jgi:Rrf2 family iron-sulfur cluster assembly transcriptional regulator
MRLSLQLQYAVCGVFDLAYNGAGTLVRIQEVGERQGIPTRYLEQIFQRLRRGGIVASKRGPGGGYCLAREPAKITLLEILEAVEGPLEGTLEMPSDGASEGSAYRPDFVWRLLAARFAGALEELSVEDLCRDAAGAGVERAEGPMYFI